MSVGFTTYKEHFITRVLRSGFTSIWTVPWRNFGCSEPGEYYSAISLLCTSNQRKRVQIMHPRTDFTPWRLGVVQFP